MNDDAVLDTSFIASIFFKDRFTIWARKKLRELNGLMTLDFSKIELYNVAWKRIKLFKEPEKVILNALNKAILFLGTIEIFKADDYLEKALDLALRLGISIYDSLFLSLALEKKTLFATTDLKLLIKIAKVKEVRDITIAPPKATYQKWRKINHDKGGAKTHK